MTKLDRYYWDEAVQRSGLKSATRHVAHVLVTFCSDGKGYLTYKDLCERTGYGESTARRSVEVLARCGFLEVHHSGGIATPNNYTFNVPANLPALRPAVADRPAVYEGFAASCVEAEAEYLAGRGLARKPRATVSRTVAKDGMGKFVKPTTVSRTEATVSGTDVPTVSRTDEGESTTVSRTADEALRRYDVPDKKPTTKKPTTSSAADASAAAPVDLELSAEVQVEEEPELTVEDAWLAYKLQLEDLLNDPKYDGYETRAYVFLLKAIAARAEDLQLLSPKADKLLGHRVIGHAADRLLEGAVAPKSYSRLFRTANSLGPDGPQWVVSAMAHTALADVQGDPTSYVIRVATNKKAEATAA